MGKPIKFDEISKLTSSIGRTDLTNNLSEIKPTSRIGQPDTWQHNSYQEPKDIDEGLFEETQSPLPPKAERFDPTTEAGLAETIRSNYEARKRTPGFLSRVAAAATLFFGLSISTQGCSEYKRTFENEGTTGSQSRAPVPGTATLSGIIELESMRYTASPVAPIPKMGAVAAPATSTNEPHEKRKGKKALVVVTHVGEDVDDDMDEASKDHPSCESDDDGSYKIPNVDTTDHEEEREVHFDVDRDGKCDDHKRVKIKNDDDHHEDVDVSGRRTKLDFDLTIKNDQEIYTSSEVGDAHIQGNNNTGSVISALFEVWNKRDGQIFYTKNIIFTQGTIDLHESFSILGIPATNSTSGNDYATRVVPQLPSQELELSGDGHVKIKVTKRSDLEAELLLISPEKQEITDMDEADVVGEMISVEGKYKRDTLLNFVLEVQDGAGKYLLPVSGSGFTGDDVNGVARTHEQYASIIIPNPKLPGDPDWVISMTNRRGQDTDFAQPLTDVVFEVYFEQTSAGTSKDRQYMDNFNVRGTTGAADNEKPSLTVGILNHLLASAGEEILNTTGDPQVVQAEQALGLDGSEWENQPLSVKVKSSDVPASDGFASSGLKEVTLDYGDGTLLITLTPTDGSVDQIDNHIYTTDGIYTIIVTSTDNANNQTTQTYQVMSAVGKTRALTIILQEAQAHNPGLYIPGSEQASPGNMGNLGGTGYVLVNPDWYFVVPDLGINYGSIQTPGLPVLAQDSFDGGDGHTKGEDRVTLRDVASVQGGRYLLRLKPATSAMITDRTASGKVGYSVKSTLTKVGK